MSVKMSIQGIGRSSVFTSRFYLLKKAKNALGANYNNFHFFSVFKVLQCRREMESFKIVASFSSYITAAT